MLLGKFWNSRIGVHSMLWSHGYSTTKHGDIAAFWEQIVV